MGEEFRSDDADITLSHANSNWDFSGWATRNDILCSDGRTIRRDAFAAQNGETVPIVYNHQHGTMSNVLGHGLLENRKEGVYFYGSLNDTDAGKDAKKAIQHGDITALSIYANQLKQKGGDVVHGVIREVSLVLAGANPGAFIDTVLTHSADGGVDDGATIYTGLDLDYVRHSDEDSREEDDMSYYDNNLYHSEEEEDKGTQTPAGKQGNKDAEKLSKETIMSIVETMNEKQKTALYALIGAAVEAGKEEKSEGGTDMKHNVFDTDEQNSAAYLSHADEADIISRAKSSSVGSLKAALNEYVEENSLAHSIDDIENLFPEYHDTNAGEPSTITRDYTWVDAVMNGVRKSPYARVRTRWVDARKSDFRGKGYQKGKEKALIGNVAVLKRTTDPQTVYVKDSIERDDIIDITDFDVVAYQYKLMRMALNEELALAMLVGDGRDAGEEAKIYEDHIRPIWKDDEMYTIHKDVDFAAAKKEIQGTNTSANFGENYIYAEAIIAATLEAREQYKGSGSLTFYCTPHTLNIMLLARDLNGRRIYNSKSDLVAALNVKDIETVEQFDGLTRTTSDSKTKKLLGIFVNLNDYQLGCAKGGEITKFQDFDIDFNKEKFLLETRVSGALTEIYSAIALEEDVTTATAEG